MAKPQKTIDMVERVTDLEELETAKPADFTRYKVAAMLEGGARGPAFDVKLIVRRGDALHALTVDKQSLPIGGTLKPGETMHVLTSTISRKR